MEGPIILPICRSDSTLKQGLRKQASHQQCDSLTPRALSYPASHASMGTDGDIRVTLHYTHSDLERRREAIEEMTARLYPDGAVGVIGCPNNDVKSRKVSEEAAGRSKVVGRRERVPVSPTRRIT